MIEKILDRLDGVRQTSSHKWVARCPSHDDKSPSLSLAEVDDRILIHCFGGCDVTDVVAAIDLNLTDLFPPRETNGKPIRRRIDYRGAWLLARHSFYVLNLATSDIEKGGSLSGADLETVTKARKNINAILEYING